ncbi:hypothetical protein L873DRAFT_1836176 [Choiromyces venosus 120613-1]|uniref:Tc1-like transposase DDE domain-containing protein n=1 Tax=Choiromyces venosus 120613-1 TaxID=1336337 RepID=A0A3N4JI70_9PEZI|nr:hypothetical protein L873DRAFT_1836176 [Choiromyces venosus 120613-1]
MISLDGIHRRIKKALSSRSARAWLSKLGWNWKEVRKGIYKDGHEREDVKEYRTHVFLPRLQALQSRMMQWDESLTIIPKEYEPGVRPIVFVTHDESTFNSNEGRRRIWIHEDQAPLRKKGRGQGLHVSDFLTPVGRLGNGDVCEILKCGGDTWWTGELMLKQLTEKAIPAFETSFPGCQGLFAFDNAKNHQKYASDALRSGNLNLTPGGKNTLPMRDGWFKKAGNPVTMHTQCMMLPDGRVKGLKIVLEERGLWPTNRKLLTQCTIPGDTPGQRKPNPACKYGSNTDCCARALLSSQPDFQAQKGELQETLEAAGHMVIFYPSFHCELNFIEYFWGSAKVYARANCEYTFSSLVRIVPEALAQVPNKLIWKYYQRILRMMEAYRHDLVYGSDDFKKHVFTRYSSHR